jgi:RNA processing factor Prp31
MDIQVIDINNMTISEINNEIKRLDNKLYYWLDEKERAFEKTQPKASDIAGERVQGGTTREDKNLCYIIKNEDIDKKINDIQQQIFHLTKYVENELKRIGEYDPLMKKIVELRETQDMTWNKIAQATNYSDSQCKKIYRKYKNERNV